MTNVLNREITIASSLTCLGDTFCNPTYKVMACAIFTAYTKLLTSSEPSAFRSSCLEHVADEILHKHYHLDCPQLRKCVVRSDVRMPPRLGLACVEEKPSTADPKKIKIGRQIQGVCGQYLTCNFYECTLASQPRFEPLLGKAAEVWTLAS